jgi:RNase P subunit RPR2
MDQSNQLVLVLNFAKDWFSFNQAIQLLPDQWAIKQVVLALGLYYMRVTISVPSGIYRASCTSCSNLFWPAKTNPSNSLTRVFRSSEPRTMRGFLLWAPDRPHGHPPPKTVSNPVSSQNLLTFLQRYGTLEV